MFFRILCHSVSIWLVSITALSLLTASLSANDTPLNEALLEKFSQIKENSPEIRKALVEGYCLLDTLVQEINIKYQYSLTLIEAARLVKSNLSQFQFPAKAQSSLLILINFIELADTQLKDSPHIASASITGCIPLILKWAKADKRSLVNKVNVAALAVNLPLPEQPEGEPSANLVVGAVEILAGALLCIIPHPVTWGIGGGMILDGLSRVLDDLPLSGETASSEISFDSDASWELYN